MEKSINIAYLSDNFDYSACAYLRILMPLEYLSKTFPRISYRNGIVKHHVNRNIPNMDVLNEADIVIVQRTACIFQPYDQLRMLANPNVKVVFELDDNFFEFPKNHSDYIYFDKIKHLMVTYLERADLVTVSTENLKEYYSKYNPNIVVFPNSVNIDDFPNSKEDYSLNKWEETIRQNANKILFSGSLTHSADFQVVEPLLYDLLKKYADLELIMWGGTIETKIMMHPNVTFIPDTYKDYKQYLRRLSDFAGCLAVVPLVDDVFNSAKSNIKHLEYAMTGILGAYSDVGEYRDLNPPAVFANKAELWIEFLKTKFEDANRLDRKKDLMLFLIEEQSRIFEKRDISKTAWVLENAYKSLLPWWE